MFQKRHKNKIGIVFLILMSVFILTTVVSAQVTPVAVRDREDFTQIYERDVYVVVGSTLRHPTEATASDASLYNEAGVFLNMNWGMWQTAQATAIAQVQGGQKNRHTDVDLHLTGLVPGGVYSIFYGTLSPDSENPLCPGVERTLPLTAVKPSPLQPDPSSFVADAHGRANFQGRAPGNLFNAIQVFYFVIYHDDRQTYDPLPNRGEFLTQGSNCRSSFGQDAMRQLIIYQKF